MPNRASFLEIFQGMPCDPDPQTYHCVVAESSAIQALLVAAFQQQASQLEMLEKEAPGTHPGTLGPWDW